MMRTTVGAAPQADQTLNILLIEEAQTKAEAHRVRLERDGYSVEHASGGQSAIERAIERPPDLILPQPQTPVASHTGPTESGS